MAELEINPKFKDLLPPLSDEELRQLEESILSEGVREAIKVWQGQIVDGHNRFSICQRHDLPYPVMDMFFADEDEALEWIYINQLARRNLSDFQRKHYVGKLYNLRKARHGGDRGNQHTGGKERQSETISFSQKEQNLASGNSYHLPDEMKNTAEKIAEDFGLSEKTVRTAGKVVEILEKEPELEKEFLAGKVTQKEVIQSANPKPELSDDFIEAVRKQAGIVEIKFRLLNDELKKLSRLFVQNKCDLADFAPGLAKQFSLSKANDLRRFARCACSTGCDQCGGTGYTANNRRI